MLVTVVYLIMEHGVTVQMVIPMLIADLLHILTKALDGLLEEEQLHHIGDMH